MVRVVWRPDALNDLDEIAAYIEQFNPPAADRAYARLRLLGDSLRTSPRRGRPTAYGTRQIVVAKPYVLTYVIEGDDVYILHIRHSARRPLA